MSGSAIASVGAEAGVGAIEQRSIDHVPESDGRWLGVHEHLSAEP